MSIFTGLVYLFFPRIIRVEYLEAENKNKAEENSVILMDLEKQAITSKDRWVGVIRVYIIQVPIYIRIIYVLAEVPSVSMLSFEF